jgi:hypothetical protein
MSHGLQQVREEILALVEFLASFGPRNVLEIGSASGASFYLWCRLADRRAKVISVDLPGGIYGGEENADPAVRTRRDETMRSWAPNAHLIAGDSKCPEVRRHVAEILGDDRLDFLLIDGDHAYPGVRADYEGYRGFVQEGGVHRVSRHQR